MSRYVDADKASIYLNSAACEQMKQMPTADVQEVKRGKWFLDLNYDDVMCTNCKAQFNTWDNETYRFKYCPNCGARMEDDDE